jgi:hypothetical protein
MDFQLIYNSQNGSVDQTFTPTDGILNNIIKGGSYLAPPLV